MGNIADTNILVKNYNFYLKTNNLHLPLFLSVLIGKELTSKWLFEKEATLKWSVEVTLKGNNQFNICVKNDAPALFRRKNFLKERDSIFQLLIMVKKQIQGDKQNNKDKEPKVQGIETVRGESINPKERDIETEIRPLVEMLNKIESIQTVFSCQGHLLRVPSSPYVIFTISKTEKVFMIHKLLSLCRTHFIWRLKGIVQNTNIHWVIFTEQQRTPFNSKKMREDIETLCRTLASHFMNEASMLSCWEG